MCGVPVCLIGGGTSLQTKLKVFRYKKRRSNCLVKNILYLCNRHYGNGDYLRWRYNELQFDKLFPTASSTLRFRGQSVFRQERFRGQSVFWDKKFRGQSVFWQKKFRGKGKKAVLSLPLWGVFFMDNVRLVSRRLSPTGLYVLWIIK